MLATVVRSKIVKKYVWRMNSDEDEATEDFFQKPYTQLFDFDSGMQL